jgi:hypothetical protein
MISANKTIIKPIIDQIKISLALTICLKPRMGAEIR